MRVREERGAGRQPVHGRLRNDSAAPSGERTGRAPARLSDGAAPSRTWLLEASTAPCMGALCCLLSPSRLPKGLRILLALPT